MPTIGQLPAANSVADTDLLPIFQNDETLSATRAQLLAGVQAALTVPPNTLLGGTGPGSAPPVPISLGANLALTGATLSATGGLNIGSLPTGTVPGPGDIVPIGQSGTSNGVSYANFLAGMGGVAGLPGGALTAKASAATTTRTLAAMAMNAVSVEDFGAVGDGVTDDSAALIAAASSGNPVRLGAKTYAIAGECDLSSATCTLLGVPGLTILKRSAQSKLGTSPTPAWISLSAATVIIDGVIFDANTAVSSLAFGVYVQPSCTKSVITRSVFRNTTGGGNGSGLTYWSSDPALTAHDIDGCEFYGNSVHGFYALATDGLSISNCRSHDNAVDGIHIDSQDPTFTLKIRYLRRRQFLLEQCLRHHRWQFQRDEFQHRHLRKQQPGRPGRADRLEQLLFEPRIRHLYFRPQYPGQRQSVFEQQHLVRRRRRHSLRYRLLQGHRQHAGRRLAVRHRLRRLDLYRGLG
jgi:hypothetical protein